MIRLPLELKVSHIVFLESKYEWSVSIEIGERFTNYGLRLNLGWPTRKLVWVRTEEQDLFILSICQSIGCIVSVLAFMYLKTCNPISIFVCLHSPST